MVPMLETVRWIRFSVRRLRSGCRRSGIVYIPAIPHLNRTRLPSTWRLFADLFLVKLQVDI
jgi:hypothetical protein